ncbi:MAG: tributyrin esterase [Euryarchaeota archaeon]|nr:tributyrin esterase [Euryarchaeota archaeon]
MAEPKLSRTEDINRAIRKMVDLGGTAPVSGLKGHDCIAVGLPAGAVVQVTGSAGDFFAALNNGGAVSLTGDSGRFAGDLMTAGELVLNGDSSGGVGQYMRGGTIMVKGDCKGPAGQLMKGGTLVIDGNAGREVGKYMMGGEIIVNGSVGEHAGENMMGGVIFVKEEVRSPGLNARLSRPGSDDLERLRYLNKQYRFRGITDEEVFQDFQKISPESPRPLIGEAPK